MTRYLSPHSGFRTTPFLFAYPTRSENNYRVSRWAPREGKNGSSGTQSRKLNDPPRSTAHELSIGCLHLPDATREESVVSLVLHSEEAVIPFVLHNMRLPDYLCKILKSYFQNQVLVYETNQGQ